MDSDQITAIKHELREEGYNIYVYSYPGGMCFPKHSHNHDTVHVVLSGTIKVIIDGDEFILKIGERFPIAAGIVHYAEVLGDTPLVCIDATKPK
jgi:quercetin dioxygenase-like cupin family protein